MIAWLLISFFVLLFLGVPIAMSGYRERSDDDDDSEERPDYS